MIRLHFSDVYPCIFYYLFIIYVNASCTVVWKVNTVNPVCLFLIRFIGHYLESFPMRFLVKRFHIFVQTSIFHLIFPLFVLLWICFHNSFLALVNHSNRLRDSCHFLTEDLFLEKKRLNMSVAECRTVAIEMAPLCTVVVPMLVHR